MARTWVKQLPAEYLDPEVLSALSIDAQIYYECATCLTSWRLNQTLSLVSPHEHDGAECPSRDGGLLRLQRHVLHIEAACLDCANQWFLSTNAFEPIHCPACASRSYFPISTFVHPPMATSCKNVDRDRRVWGKDPFADTKAIIKELSGSSLRSDSAQHLVPSILFASRLAESNDYTSSDAWAMLNTTGNLAREYYRQTSESTAGVFAVETFARCAEMPAKVWAKAAVEHNVAMAAYSLVAREQGNFEFADGVGRYRNIGLDAARRALALYASEDPTQETLKQMARVRHVLADLLRVYDPTAEEVEDALEIIDLALAEPALSPKDRDAAEQSRAHILHQSGNGDDASIGAMRALLQSAADNQSLPLRERYGALMNLAAIEEAASGPAGAVQTLTRAAQEVSHQVAIADDEASLGQATAQFRQAYDDLARVLVALNRPREALQAVETVRAATVRFANETEHDACKRIEATVDWTMQRLLGRESLAVKPTRRRNNVESVLSGLRWLRGKSGPSPQSQFLRVEQLDSALESLSGEGWPRDAAICSLAVSSGQLSAILARPSNRGLDWSVDAYQWPLNAERLTSGIQHLLDPQPSAFREARLRKGCRLVAQEFSGMVELLSRSKLSSLALSAPGLLSHIPYEGLPVDGGAGVLGEYVDIAYMPSVLLGARLGARSKSQTIRRVLAVGYGGDDLPRAAEEVEFLKNLWGSRAEVLDGGTCNKADILAALRDGTYDILHFCCHGTFNLWDPLQSRLYLSGDHSRDAKTVTAEDLLRVRLNSAPTVILSACSTALTSYGLTNDCTGLTGSFLRIGARAVIGSRWPVYDDLATDFVRFAHAALEAGATPHAAVLSAQRESRKGDRIENWAAFSYLGLPQLAGSRAVTGGR